MQSQLSFDLEKLNFLLRDFYNLTRIRITVFDNQFRELSAYPEHLSPFCQLIRTSPAGAAGCLECDNRACQTAAGRRTPYTYRCHAGLTESIAPIHLGKLVVGYLFFGQVFSYPQRQKGWEEIRSLCQDYDLDPKELNDACHTLPLIKDDYIASASHILQAVASYLCLEQMVSLRKQELPGQIQSYLSEHLHQELNTAALCKHFDIGKTQLYEISRQHFGMGIAEYIRTLRIEKAKKLLRDSSLSLSEIAYQCGFKDYNYFITIFRQKTGCPPKKYAKAR